MEPHDHADVVLFRVHDLLVVGVHQHGQHTAVHAQGRLHHIGDVALVGLLVEVGQILAGDVLVLGQVVVGAVRHPHSSPQPKGNRNSKSVVALSRNTAPRARGPAAAGSRP